MVSVFDFEDDFRDYLKQFIKEKELSYRAIGLKTELDHRVVYDIVNNKKKHLSRINALKLSNAFKHAPNEQEYFIQLVHLTQSKDLVESDFCRKQMLKIKCEIDGLKPASVDKYEYYSTLRHSTVRSLLALCPFQDDYKRLGSVLSPPISTEEVKESVQLLERLGLIHKKADGTYYLNDENIWANISNEGKKRFHRECAELVKKQIFYYYPNDCQILSATLGMSRKTYEIVCDESRKLLEKTLKLVKNDRKADRVYQCQLAVVPLSVTINPE